MNAPSLLTVHGITTVTGHNAQRVVEVEPKSEPEKSKLKPEMEDNDAMEPIPIFNFAMNSLAQLTACGMTTAPGVNVTRIVEEEPNTELVPFTKQPNSVESHAKEEKRKKLLVMKTHAQ
jgi:hypothetical protein